MFITRSSEQCFACCWGVVLLNVTPQCLANISPVVALSGVCGHRGRGETAVGVILGVIHCCAVGATGWKYLGRLGGERGLDTAWQWGPYVKSALCNLNSVITGNLIALKCNPFVCFSG